MSNEQTTREGAENTESTNGLDPKIAHHSTYIDETKRILDTYVESGSYSELKRQVLEENILNKNTDEYRTNVLREITRRHIPDTDECTVTPLMRVVTGNLGTDVVEWCLYYEFAQDPFIYRVTVDFLYPEFERGTLNINSADIVEFLQDIKDEHEELRARSETTIERAASMYLTALRNFDLLEGRRNKEFAVTYVPDKTIAYVVYQLANQGVTAASEVIGHTNWKLFLMDESTVRRRIRNIDSRYVTYEKRGSTERLVRKYDTTEELIHAF